MGRAERNGRMLYVHLVTWGLGAGIHVMDVDGMDGWGFYVGDRYE